MFVRTLLTVFFVALCCSGSLAAWSCALNGTGKAVDVKAISGIWYGAARVPNEPREECLNITIPDAVGNDNKLSMQLTYISTMNGGWKPKTQQISFPWQQAQQGIFSMQTGDGHDITYKLISLNASSLALLCGVDATSSKPIFKVMTRDREIERSLKSRLQYLATTYQIGNLVVWEEQSLELCRSAGHAQQVLNWSMLLGLLGALWQVARSYAS